MRLTSVQRRILQEADFTNRSHQRQFQSGDLGSKVKRLSDLMRSGHISQNQVIALAKLGSQIAGSVTGVQPAKSIVFPHRLTLRQAIPALTQLDEFDEVFTQIRNEIHQKAISELRSDLDRNPQTFDEIMDLTNNGQNIVMLMDELSDSYWDDGWGDLVDNDTFELLVDVIFANKILETKSLDLKFEDQDKYGFSGKFWSYEANEILRRHVQQFIQNFEQNL